jgi:GNAT superfamily N-acetyltransferase
MKNNSIIVRIAAAEDVPVIFLLINEKAEADREIGSFDGSVATSEDNIRQALFGKNAFVHALLAEIDGHPVGFALYYYCYSSFHGQSSIWLEDLFIKSVVRNRGIGTKLIQQLSQTARNHQCERIM